MFDKNDIEQVCKLVADHVHELQEEANRRNVQDYQVDMYPMILRAWLNGLDGVVPTELQPFVDQLHKQKDPDYQLYLQLKARFET